MRLAAETMNEKWTLRSQITAIPTGFFAYASSPPSIPPTISAAIEAINKTQTTSITSWEGLSVGGKYIISEICAAIEENDYFCADITTINPNVMFELGFAIARNKRIWLIRDESYTDPKKEFEQLRLLTTIGYSPYVNSGQIISAFFKEKPHLTLTETIFKQSIEPTLGPRKGPESVFYLKSKHDTEASVRATRVLQDSNLPLTVDDPRETSVQPLYWYAQNLLGSLGMVAHFLGANREGFRLHNARYALVSGLAKGLDARMLMLTEHSELLAPMDYRDAMRYYTTPQEAARYVDEWLQTIPALSSQPFSRPIAYGGALKLATELKDFHLQLGEYVAENEAETLPEYFVDNTAYTDVVNGTQTIFVGRKGTGKTANLIQAASNIERKTGSLVCVLKPVAYQIEGLVRLFTSYKLQDYKGYVLESLWKYMLYTEIARAAAQQIQDTSLWQLNEPESRRLIDLLDGEQGSLGGDFTVRLERVVNSLETVKQDVSSEQFHAGISEALHSGKMGVLRSILGDVVDRKNHIIVLVDNLDKPWTRSADLQQLAEFLLGLITAAGRVHEEIRKQSKNKKYMKFNIAIFLRSDIFYRVQAVAREPDKLSYTKLTWSDPELLLRVIEERYVASHGVESDPSKMWHRYFCGEVKGVPTRHYLTSRILPRPRDIIYFVKAAVSLAVNRKHDRVEEKDILDGEKQYSQYAMDSILVENGISIPQLESVLYEFVGRSSVVLESEVKQYVSNTSIDIEKVDDVIAHLVALTFLGLEVSIGHFAYSDEPKHLKKNVILAQRVAKEENREPRYEVNPAFRAFLEITEAKLP